MVVDLFLVYQFIRRLATPFNKWDAYKLGVINDKGDVLVNKKERDSAQRKAWGIFDRMVANIKKLLAKVPGGSTRLASYAAALYLIKEWNHFSDESLLNEDITDEQLDESLLLLSSVYLNYNNLSEDVNSLLQQNEACWTGYKQVGMKKKNGKEVPNCVPEENELEETPANNVGSGNIAGMDGGHVSKQGQKKWTSQNKSKKKRLRDIMGDLK